MVGEQSLAERIAARFTYREQREAFERLVRRYHDAFRQKGRVDMRCFLETEARGYSREITSVFMAYVGLFEKSRAEIGGSIDDWRIESGAK